MRSLLLAVVAIVASGCGMMTDEERLDKYGPAIAASDEPWLSEALDKAVAFWQRQGVKFDNGLPEGVTVVSRAKLVNSDAAAEYDCRAKQIAILPEESDNSREAVCLLAHEMGHMVGMDHVATGRIDDLMDTVVGPDPFGDCFWSLKDERELKRAQKRGPRC